MQWVEVFSVFVVSHLVGDFVLQTQWQAVNKHGGLTRGNALGRSALVSHVLSYTAAFVPCLAWLAGELSWAVLAVAAAVFVPHLIQDDGRLVAAYMRRVKKADPDAFPIVAMALDQSLHVVALLALAIVSAQ